MGGQQLAPLLWAAGSFLASHFVLSHLLRRPLVRIIGERVYLLVYTVLAIGTFTWLVIAFANGPRTPLLWDGFGWTAWIIASVLTLPALALFIGSFMGNPALPGTSLAGVSARKPFGAFAVTRHPMMWGFALWAMAHAAVSPSPRGLVLTGTILLLALAGSAGQDSRKFAQAPREWGVWRERTSFFPRLSRLGAIGGQWWLALALWLVVTAAHMPLGGIPAGLWRLFG